MKPITKTNDLIFFKHEWVLSAAFNLWFVFNQDEPLGGWFVQRVIDGKEEEAVEYRFTPKYILKGGQSVTVSFCVVQWVCVKFLLIFVNP